MFARIVSTLLSKTCCWSAVSSLAPVAQAGPAAPLSAMSKKLIVLFVVAFVDMIGSVMILPLLPFYATDLGASATMVCGRSLSAPLRTIV